MGKAIRPRIGETFMAYLNLLPLELRLLALGKR